MEDRNNGKERIQNVKAIKWNALKTSMLGIGVALLLDLGCYLVSRHSDLFGMLFGR